MILDYSDDETDSVEWIKDTTSNKNSLIDVFDCGCCDDCLCDYMMDCNNCKCSCCSNINEDDDNLEEKKEIDYKINEFTIDVFEDKNKERKVKISLNLNLENKRSININLDIKSALYLQIADELIK
jgi:hypothetical protein